MKQEIKITLELVGVQNSDKQSVVLQVDNNTEEHYLKIKFLNNLKDYVEYSNNVFVLDDLVKLAISYSQDVPEEIYMS